jgi:hypothetical protein
MFRELVTPHILAERYTSIPELRTWRDKEAGSEHKGSSMSIIDRIASLALWVRDSPLREPQRSRASRIAPCPSRKLSIRGFCDYCADNLRQLGPKGKRAPMFVS